MKTRERQRSFSNTRTERSFLCLVSFKQAIARADDQHVIRRLSVAEAFDILND